MPSGPLILNENRGIRDSSLGGFKRTVTVEIGSVQMKVVSIQINLT